MQIKNSKNRWRIWLSQQFWTEDRCVKPVVWLSTSALWRRCPSCESIKATVYSTSDFAAPPASHFDYLPCWHRLLCLTTYGLRWHHPQNCKYMKHCTVVRARPSHGCSKHVQKTAQSSDMWTDIQSNTDMLTTILWRSNNGKIYTPGFNFSTLFLSRNWLLSTVGQCGADGL